jgi:hypothetical protein
MLVDAAVLVDKYQVLLGLRVLLDHQEDLLEQPEVQDLLDLLDLKVFKV